MKPISIHRIGRTLRKNRKGGIEGLPLQLMIIIMIATIGTAIIVGWMGNIEEPHSIREVTVDSGDIDLTRDDTTLSSYAQGTSYRLVNEDVVISVFDQNMNPLPGASVVLDGLGIVDKDGCTVHGITDDNGTVTFTGLKLRMTGHTGFIDIEVSKSGYGENSSCRIFVIA